VYEVFSAGYDIAKTQPSTSARESFGNIYEGRDLRFKGEHVREHNTGAIGVVLLENLAEPQEGGDAVATVKSLLANILT
jgi:hypothetical protein